MSLDLEKLFQSSLDTVLNKELEKRNWISTIDKIQFNDCNNVVSAEFLRNKHNISNEVIRDFIFHNESFIIDSFEDRNDDNSDFSNINEYIYLHLVYSELEDNDDDFFRRSTHIASEEFREFLRESINGKSLNYLNSINEFFINNNYYNKDLINYLNSGGSKFYNDLKRRIEKLHIESKISVEPEINNDNTRVKRRL